MPHEMANWIDPNRSDPAKIHGQYIKTRVDADDGWEWAVIEFIGVQRNYRDGRFSSDTVDGTPALAKRIIDYVQEHEAEILNHFYHFRATP